MEKIYKTQTIILMIFYKKSLGVNFGQFQATAILPDAVLLKRGLKRKTSNNPFLPVFLDLRTWFERKILRIYLKNRGLCTRTGQKFSENIHFCVFYNEWILLMIRSGKSLNFIALSPHIPCYSYKTGHCNFHEMEMITGYRKLFIPINYLLPSCTPFWGSMVRGSYYEVIIGN